MNFLELNNSILDSSLRQLFYHGKRKIFQWHNLKEFDLKHPCIFVLSTGRVGTKTLAALFSLASNIFSYHEPHPKLYGLSKLSYQIKKNEQLNLVLRESFLTCRKKIFDFALKCEKGHIETGPHTTFLASIIKQVVPNARFIHVVRDPYAVIISGMKRKWYAGNPADKYRIEPHSNSEIFHLWKDLNQFQKNIWLWMETNKWIYEFTQKLPREQYIVIHAEKVFAYDQQTIKELFRFINSPVPSSQKIKKLLAKKMNIQKHGEFFDPTKWTNKMNEQLLSIACPIAELFGYNLSPQISKNC